MTKTIIFRLHPLMSSHWCCLMSRTLSLNSEYSTTTRRWHVTISCQPDGRPLQPVRPWKSGRVHIAEGSNVVVLELPYSTEFGRESRKFASGSENMENLMTVVDRLDELQASSVGRRECSSTRQRTGDRRMDVHVDTYSQPSPRATGCGHCPGTCHGGLARWRRLRVVVLPSSEWK